MTVIIIGVIIILALPFLVFGFLAVVAGLGLAGLRQQAGSVLTAAQQGDPVASGSDDAGRQAAP